MLTILAVDYGQRRIGAATANSVARLPAPLPVIANDATMLEKIRQVVADQAIDRVVVGLPRNLRGEETAQSQVVRQFAESLDAALQCEVVLQDETLSTAAAEELRVRYPDADADSLAASVILQDYLQQL